MIEAGLVSMLDPDMTVALCLVVDGKMIYQSPVPDLDDVEGWELMERGIRGAVGQYAESKKVTQ